MNPPPLPTIRHSPFAIRRFDCSPLTARYLRSDTPLSRNAAAGFSPFAIRYSPELLAISEVTRRYPEVWPMCFNHSPFAIRHSLF
jgi:hypothetical protein